MLICLALAAFVLRAVIPNGYMAAPSTTSLMLTLCEAGGAMNVSFDLPGQSDAKHAPADACAFGALAAHAILPEAGLTPVLAAQAAYDAPRVPVYRAAPALPPLGPPLGSRAPPSLSV
ncbi:hypothetical protein KYC_08925 [Achromobacter arsenitoxydans SY8]|uniref:Lipoprotein n=2 Tax=Achromobacter TaxID=222 RepID=H0F4U3_9BURK|nr:hypothetical protein KYC_08925 [Achromobacter arsenitoxydans SY8]